MMTLPEPLLIGMVHLPALPGSPVNRMPLAEIVAHALADARALAGAGFRAIMVENFGDAPFTGGSLEPETVASLAVVVHALRQETELLVGVNCLRNDARSAIGIASACDAHYIRVNVHTGVAATDQGVLEGRAYDTLRHRARLGPEVRIFADVHVKHAAPVSQPDIALAAEETAYRGMADAVIVSGSTTGRPADLDELRRVTEAVPDKPVLVGSGATADSIAGILRVADGAIVGSSLKPGGDITLPIDARRARAFVDAATC